MVLFIIIALYILYNLIQMIRASAGKRFENPALLLFLAAPLDLFNFIKSKIKK